MWILGIYLILIGLVAIGAFISQTIGFVRQYKRSKDQWFLEWLPMNGLFLAIAFFFITGGIYMLI